MYSSGKSLRVVTAAVAALVMAAQSQAADKGQADRQAFFGDLHLHTSYSFDAYVLMGQKVEPDAAYKFARGEPVQYLGETIKRSTPPLDFLAVTDHSENIGVFRTLEDPDSPLSKSEVGAEVRRDGPKAFSKLITLGASGLKAAAIPGVDAATTSRSAWQREIEVANSNNQPGKFTTFIAYEWTAMPDGQNLHRNVIFRGDTAPNPFTSADSSKPEDLWGWLDAIRHQGYEALAIPHNSNASNGLMYDWVDSRGKPIDQSYAEDRARNEPLSEISQNKGASETLPELSPNDEFANFERYDHLLTASFQKSKPGGSYVRDALGRGLILADKAGGANPYKYGVVGASDYHNGLSDSGESAYAGTMGAIDPSKELPDVKQYWQRLSSVAAGVVKQANLSPEQAKAALQTSYWETGSGNLTGVWAEENTRASIYDAFRRKETFATSGSRIKARFFGGWKLEADPTQDRDWVRKAYATGVPQGSDLPANSTGAPNFALWAVKDPNGANLDRIQVIKLAAKDGQYVESIYDVAVSDHRKIDPKTHRAPALTSTVDVKSAKYSNTVGAAELTATWRDPDFDARLPAVYYVRVLEIQTPRWSTIAAVKRGVEPPEGFPLTVQERAWTSPIWYTPQKGPDQRQAFFGDLHLHTSYSFDAYVLMGAKVDPDQAYKFGRGEPVQYLGETIQRSTPPLDFLAVTDHSENIGVFNTLEDPNSPLSQSEIGHTVHESGAKAFGKIVQLMTTGHPLPGVDVSATAQSAWQRQIDFANRNYQPGKFTTFIAYEWSSMPDGQNLHRNVIFRGNNAPHPFSSVDSNKPEALWTWLDGIRKQGYEALAIPHNSNASNGLMFDWVDSKGKPIDQAYAEDRAANEPLAEISQNKGASETLPELSPGDEFASFERYDHLLVSPLKSKPEGSYVRDALGRGLIIAGKGGGGVDPYKYGFVGASDFHNGLSDSAENAYVGSVGAVDPTKQPPDPAELQAKLGDVRAQLSGLVKTPPGTKPPQESSPLAAYYEGASGNLTGVWAEANTRESIYDALRRKETFATSGTRIKARFFGGWKLQANPVKDKDWLHNAYATGVSQGADLPERGSAVGAPTFAVWAVKDPNGANLDRIQIIKLVAEGNKYSEKIYDVAASDHRKINPATHHALALTSTVDLKTAQYTNTVGAAELAATWQDPDFDANLSAVYYVRVLEIQTPRWSTIAAVKRRVAPPVGFPTTIQERAWTSPIWYTPKKTRGNAAS